MKILHIDKYGDDDSVQVIESDDHRVGLFGNTPDTMIANRIGMSVIAYRNEVTKLFGLKVETRKFTHSKSFKFLYADTQDQVNKWLKWVEDTAKVTNHKNESIIDLQKNPSELSIYSKKRIKGLLNISNEKGLGKFLDIRSKFERIYDPKLINNIIRNILDVLDSDIDLKGVVHYSSRYMTKNLSMENFEAIIDEVIKYNNKKITTYFISSVTSARNVMGKVRSEYVEKIKQMILSTGEVYSIFSIRYHYFLRVMNPEERLLCVENLSKEIGEFDNSFIYELLSNLDYKEVDILCSKLIENSKIDPIRVIVDDLTTYEEQSMFYKISKEMLEKMESFVVINNLYNN